MRTNARALLAVLLLTGCTNASRSPDAIRQDTASATAAAARDAKAVAQGVVEGLKTKGPLNINRASQTDLANLPGIDDATAQRIVAGRPYQNSAELLRRRIISKPEYDRIANQIEAR